MSSMRILPVLAMVLMALLGLKTFEVWTGFRAIATATASSAPDKRGDAEHAAPAPESNAHGPAPADASHDAPDHEASPTGGEDHDAPAQTQVKRQAIPGESEVVSASEVEVLQSLAERREALKAREAALDVKENLLAAAEIRMDEKIAELRALEAQIKSALNTLDEQEEAQIKSLVKVYEAMKPKDAAPILQNLDRPILISVVSRMKEAKMAAILAQMEPKIAQEVTVLLATHTEIPGPTASGG